MLARITLELVTRTGLNPTVSFPFIRGPYLRYSLGSSVEDRFWDDSMSARMMSKDLLLYLDSFTEAELEDFTVTMTEGAESGMVGLRGESRVYVLQQHIMLTLLLSFPCTVFRCYGALYRKDNV